MRGFDAYDFKPAPEGNGEMMVTATGKRLIISQANTRWRNGRTVSIDDWLYAKIFGRQAVAQPGSPKQTVHAN